MIQPPQEPHSPNNYHILSITPPLLTTSPSPTALLKKAYRRALLQNHPDKHNNSPNLSGNPPTPTPTPTAPSNQRPPRYTVDQITTAYKTLVSPALRAEYDARLLASARSVPAGTAAAGGAAQEEFQTGVEGVDLDDLDYDAGARRWSRSCRCGNPRGYSLTEQDLEEASEDGEVLLGCQDCSLWLRVHFAVVEDDEDG